MRVALRGPCDHLMLNSVMLRWFSFAPKRVIACARCTVTYSTGGLRHCYGAAQLRCPDVSGGFDRGSQAQLLLSHSPQFQA